MGGHCLPLDDPKNDWSFCPNEGASIFFAILFGLTFVVHAVQMFRTRKTYSLVIVFSAGLQLATYILRTLSIMNPTQTGYYSGWFICILIAPIFTNAYAYMAMGRMVYNFTLKGSVLGVKAWHFGTIFVWLDILAFLVQAGGAVVASGASDGTNTNLSLVMTGLHVYMGGIGFQQLCIFLFLGLAGRFHWYLRKQPASAERSTAFQLLYTEYAVVLLITARIIFRLIEYSDGLDSSIPRHEVYQYVFDSTLMLFALVAFNIFHPGQMMPGKETKWPKRKERKALKKQGEMTHGRAGEYLALGNTYAAGKQSHEGSDLEAGL